jgi:hypothetical protein
MFRSIKYLFASAFIFALVGTSFAQIQDPLGRVFRENEGLIRIAEPGQLADTVSLWGDINNPGRYLIPRGTTIPQLISYGRGFTTSRSGITRLDWSKLRVLISISQYNPTMDQDKVNTFKFKTTDPLPKGIRSYHLRNNEVISLELRRKPAFVDYVGVVAPVVSTILTSIIIYDQIIK